MARVALAELHLDRASGMAPCPRYTLDIDAAGIVSFSGCSEVIGAGNGTWQLTADQFYSVARIVSSARFFSMVIPEMYPILDASSMTIAITMRDGRTRTVGYIQYWRRLWSLVDRIEGAIGRMPAGPDLDDVF